MDPTAQVPQPLAVTPPINAPTAPLQSSAPSTPAPHTPTSNKNKPPSPIKSIFQIFVIALITFTLGIGSVFGYFKLFSDSTPPPPAPRSTTLGVQVSNPTLTPTPPPDTTLKPTVLENPLQGTLAYIQDNQIYTIKADRTSPDQLTTDKTIKLELAAPPNGEFLAYTFTDPSSDKKGTGLSLVNRSTKKITSLLEPADNVLQQPRISSNNEYISLWVDGGKESLIVRLNDGEVTLRYGTTQEKSISPMVWIPGSTRVSFVLVNELFGSNVNGDQLRSYATGVLGLSTQSEGTLPTLLPPVWASNGRYVAYHKNDGLYLIDTYSSQETAIQTTDDEDQGKKAPFQAISFTPASTHLLYSNKLSPENHPTYLYSIAEKKSVPAQGVSQPALTAKNLIIGSATDSASLSRYSLQDWTNNPCSSVPANLNSAHVSETGLSLASLTTESGHHALVLTDLEACTSYDLVKAPALSSPLWLPN